MNITSLVTLAALATAIAPAQSPSPGSAVAIDWAGVSDEVIARCELGDLGMLTIQQLLEQQTTVVPLGREDLRVEIVAPAGAEQVNVEVRGGSEVRSATVSLQGCDDTVRLEIAQRVGQLVQMVAVDIAPEEPPMEDAAPQPPPSTPPPPRKWHLGLGIGGTVPLTPPWGAGVLRADVTRSLPRMYVGPRLAVGATGSEGLWLVTPALGAAVLFVVTRSPKVELSLGVEAMVAAHVAGYRGQQVVDPDGRFGLPVRLRIGRHAWLEGSAAVRIQRLTYRTAGEDHLQVGRFEVSLTIGWTAL